MANAHAHLAACFMEIGDSDRSRFHGQAALELTQCVDYSELLARYCTAVAYLAFGQREKAFLEMEIQDRRLTNPLSVAIAQAWFAQKADLHWIAGDESAAIHWGLKALSSCGGTVQRSSCGDIARWTAIVASAGLAAAQVRALGKALARMEGPSLWSEAERLSALLSMVKDDAGDLERYGAKLTACICRLPPTISLHLNTFRLPNGEPC
jgi:hypothetical protein